MPKRDERVSRPMRIRLDEDRRQSLREDVQRLFREELDRELSEFQAERLVDFFVRSLGPPVYNQAVQDARKFVLERMEDLEGEVWEPEPQREGD